MDGCERMTDMRWMDDAYVEVNGWMDVKGWVMWMWR